MATVPLHHSDDHSRVGAQIDFRYVSYAALVLRIALGVVFIAHALLKPLVYTFPGTVAFFVQHGFPGWTAYPVFAAELVGGLALIAGVHTRWAALGLIPIAVGALTVHWENGWTFTAPNGGWEYVAFLIAALLVQSALGDGAYALKGPQQDQRLSQLPLSRVVSAFRIRGHP